jgi:transcriptional regulator with XRE-family HTH domain
MQVTKIRFESVGENIRRHRKAKRIKQEWLGKKVHLNKSEISRIEGGKRNISVKILLQIAVVLEIDPSQLLI